MKSELRKQKLKFWQQEIKDFTIDQLFLIGPSLQEPYENEGVSYQKFVQLFNQQVKTHGIR